MDKILPAKISFTDLTPEEVMLIVTGLGELQAKHTRRLLNKLEAQIASAQRIAKAVKDAHTNGAAASGDLAAGADKIVPAVQ